jgi:hypothetical protein
MGIFDVNKTSPVFKENFMGTDIYYIDNFYLNPDFVVKFLNENPPPMHNTPGKEQHESLNGLQFYDMRHDMIVDEFKDGYEYLSHVCGKKPWFETNRLFTNQIRFVDKNFNDYKNKYWFPHTDDGYTALVYLNKNDEQCGTNIYENVKPDIGAYLGEHIDPWRPKDNWMVLKTIKPKYNRCVIFNGNKFAHGMNITNDRYFGSEFRRNILYGFCPD